MTAETNTLAPMPVVQTYCVFNTLFVNLLLGANWVTDPVADPGGGGRGAGAPPTPPGREKIFFSRRVFKQYKNQ